MENLEPPTSHIPHPVFRGAHAPRHWKLDAGGWRCGVALFVLLFAPFILRAQTPPQIPPLAQMQLQIQQPTVDTTTPVTASAAFDPPVVRAGDQCFYRVSLDATESSIQWPDKISAPPELKFGENARGQLTQSLGNRFRPLTEFVYEMQAATAGHFTVPNFRVNVAGDIVEIPAASLDVVADKSSSSPPAQRLVLEVAVTNVFLGQPFRARVLLPASSANEIEALREVQFTGDGLMTDKSALRQSVEAANVAGELKPAFVCELTVTPIAPGPLKFSAQGFSAGREFMGPISIRGQISLPGGPTKYALLISDPVEINVRPLPIAGELPGFTGAIGKFFRDPLRLTKDRLHVGEPAQLTATFHGEGDLARFVPPVAPRSRDWQIIADPPPATRFTLIPQTDEINSTPAIPFCSFDPDTGKYVDLTIPPVPVTVVGEGLPVEVRAQADSHSAPLKLSGLAATPGKTVSSLKPLQLRGWFLGVQLAPAVGFFALWQWDRRRRFLAAHPEIVRRRRARRALRRERRQLHKAVAAGDSDDFLRHSVAALRVACAPHYPAHPQALVCADVLEWLGASNGSRQQAETVRRIFAAADAQFAAAPPSRGDLLDLDSELETLLQELEARL